MTFFFTNEMEKKFTTSTLYFYIFIRTIVYHLPFHTTTTVRNHTIRAVGLSHMLSHMLSLCRPTQSIRSRPFRIRTSIILKKKD